MQENTNISGAEGAAAEKDRKRRNDHDQITHHVLQSPESVLNYNQ